MTEEIVFERITQAELDVVGYRIMFAGPGHISFTLGTAKQEVCKAQAPALARNIKEREAIRWVSWEISPADRRPFR